MQTLMTEREIYQRIFLLRGKEVMLDKDLAELYQVETRVLKQAVKRNIKRFPDDFLFEVTNEEIEKMVSQNVIPSKKYLGGATPFAFTEQGVYMLATVLKSDIAIEVNINIMRTFAKLKEFGRHYNSLAKKLLEIDRKHDKQYRALKKEIDMLVSASEENGIGKIGFL